jgi:hypothetical protein
VIEDGRAWTNITASVRSAREAGLGNSDALVLTIWESNAKASGCRGRPTGDTLNSVLSLGAGADRKPSLEAATLAWVNHVQGRALPITTSVENRRVELVDVKLSADGERFSSLVIKLRGSVSGRDGSLEIDGEFEAEVCSGNQVASSIQNLIGEADIELEAYDNGNQIKKRLRLKVEQTDRLPWIETYNISVHVFTEDRADPTLGWSATQLMTRIGTRNLVATCAGQEVVAGDMAAPQFGTQRVTLFQIQPDCTVVREVRAEFDILQSPGPGQSRGTVSITQDQPYQHIGSGNLP